jgi:hypothetical protein
MPTPTKFQVQMHYDAMQLLTERQIAFQNETEERPTDMALKLTFRDVALWIFKDGVNVVGDGVNRAFDADDATAADRVRRDASRHASRELHRYGLQYLLAPDFSDQFAVIAAEFGAGRDHRFRLRHHPRFDHKRMVLGHPDE